MNKKKLFLKFFILVSGIMSAFLLSSCFSTAISIASCRKNCQENCSSLEEKTSGNRYGIYFTLSDDGASYFVSEVGYDATSVIIPETYEGKPVTGIKSGAFTHYVTGVGCAGTQYFGMSLSSITLPKSLKVVEDGVFGGNGASCGEVYFGGTLEDWFDIKFGSSPFNPGTRFYIGGQSVTEIAVPEAVTTVGANTFANFGRLKSVTFHAGVTQISASAFTDCYNLTALDFPCADLTIGENAFAGCTAVKEINFTGENLVLGRWAFARLENLDEVNWNSVKIEIIPEYAFENCGLKTFVIPASVAAIRENAFWGCADLCEVDNLSKLNVVAGADTHGKVAYYAGVVHTAEDDDSYILTAGDYKIAMKSSGNELFKYTGAGGALLLPQLENGEKYVVRDNAFANNDAILSVNIPDCVVKIGKSAFKGCENLKIVTGCASVLTVGDSAFENCLKLESVALVAVEEIGARAFAGCGVLTNMTLPASLKKLGLNALSAGATVKYAGTSDEWEKIERSEKASNAVTVSFSDGAKWEGLI